VHAPDAAEELQDFDFVTLHVTGFVEINRSSLVCDKLQVSKKLKKFEISREILFWQGKLTLAKTLFDFLAPRFENFLNHVKSLF
jgi:hypothetical protein